MIGGSQERRRRGGTSNIPGIVGLQKALEYSVAEMDDHRSRFVRLRRRLLENLDNTFGNNYQINGPEKGGVPHIINIGFLNPKKVILDSEMLLLNLDIEDICVSNGSACTSGAVEASHVLMALGMVTPTAKSSLRFSLGKNNTEEDIDYTLEKLDAIVHRMLQTA
jgi:cysteine desulfurase